MPNKKIFFYQKVNHRERQKDTVRYSKDIVKSISSIKKDIDLTDKKNEGAWKKRWIINKIEQIIVNYIPLINIKRLPPESNSADYIYTRGDIPLMSKKPYIIELDNPYILTYYNTFALRLFKPIIKRLLTSKRCHKIVCISQACQASLEKMLWKNIKKKTIVLYPRMEDNTNNKQERESKTINFTFVWGHPERKWVPELLKAFHSIDNKNISLTLIGFENEKRQKRYKDDKRIKFKWKQKREKILTKYLPQTDIFILPSMHESFGVSILEALSFWCGIIAVDTYAVPEMIINQENGIIIQHPFLVKKQVWKREIIDTPQFTMTEFQKKFLHWTIREELVKEIEKAIKQGIINYKNRKKKSTNLFKQKFTPNIREKTFKQIL